MATEDVDLAEFARCRDEIDNRTEISERLVLGQLTVWALGLSMLDRVPDVLLGLSAATSFIWLFWLAHTQQISKLASYIACELAPRVRKRFDEDRLLGWEQYSRIMNSAAAYKLPYPPNRSKAGIFTQGPLNNALYIFWLFAGAAPLLLSVYVVVALKKGLIVTQKACIPDFSNPLSDARMLMIFISLTIWCIAIGQYKLIARIWCAIDKRVIDMAYPTDATNVVR